MALSIQPVNGDSLQSMQAIPHSAFPPLVRPWILPPRRTSLLILSISTSSWTWRVTRAVDSPCTGLKARQACAVWVVVSAVSVSMVGRAITSTNIHCIFRRTICNNHHTRMVTGLRSPYASLTQRDFLRPVTIGHGQYPVYTRSNLTSRNLVRIGSHIKYGIDEAIHVIRRPQRAGSVPVSPKKDKIKERRPVDNMGLVNW